MKKLSDFDFSGKKVLIRVDFNVPLNSEFMITDDTRITKALPTIQAVLKGGGAVILLSHLGRPKGSYEEKYSLKHILSRLSKLLGKEAKFSEDCIGEKATELAVNLKAGEVLLLENLRFHKHETAGTESFAKSLADLGDFYINDAFGTAHRAHASTTIIARFFTGRKCFGLLMQDEIEHIDRFLEEGKKPLTAIMGGAKVSSKIGILLNLIDKVDYLMIGGGMIYTFIKAKGGQTGSSLVEEDKLEMALEILKKAESKGVKIILPPDSVVANRFEDSADKKVVPSDAIMPGWMGLDIGPASIELFSGIIKKSRCILWNGPMGVFEMKNFEEGTKKIALAIAEATAGGSYSLVGGGDSVAAINRFNMADSVTYISTGGGALMEYLEGIKLPGIKAVLD